MENKPKRKLKTPITYRPSRIERWLRLLVIPLLIPMVASFSNGESVDHLQNAILLVVVSFIAWWLLQSMFYNKFVVREHGLEIYLYGMYGFVLWEDMVRFNTILLGNSTSIGISVSRFDKLKMVWFMRIFSDIDFIALDRIVPTPTGHMFSRKLDVERFSQTPFGQDLLHFAPHLFDDEKAKHNG